ncbi:hypothetical protein FKM82_011770 [Ascaphus truei]
MLPKTNIITPCLYYFTSLKPLSLWTTFFSFIFSIQKPKRRSNRRTSSQPSVWWWECDGLGLLCCLRTWTAYHYWYNHEFCIVSEDSRGECQAIRP